MLLTINGDQQALDAPADTRLITALRDFCNLKGTQPGCDTAQCGACTVLVDGAPVKSCNVLAAQISPNQKITTIEGIAKETESGGALHIMQRAFSQHHALQCGYCTPGMIVRAIAMDAEGIAATPNAVRKALTGNLCRCTGYYGIIDAICDGLNQMRAARNVCLPRD